MLSWIPISTVSAVTLCKNCNERICISSHRDHSCVSIPLDLLPNHLHLNQNPNQDTNLFKNPLEANSILSISPTLKMSSSSVTKTQWFISSHPYIPYLFSTGDRHGLVHFWINSTDTKQDTPITTLSFDEPIVAIDFHPDGWHIAVCTDVSVILINIYSIRLKVNTLLKSTSIDDSDTLPKSQFSHILGPNEKCPIFTSKETLRGFKWTNSGTSFTVSRFTRNTPAIENTFINIYYPCKKSFLFPAPFVSRIDNQDEVDAEIQQTITSQSSRGTQDLFTTPISFSMNNTSLQQDDILENLDLSNPLVTPQHIPITRLPESTVTHSPPPLFTPISQPIYTPPHINLPLRRSRSSRYNMDDSSSFSRTSSFTGHSHGSPFHYDPGPGSSSTLSPMGFPTFENGNSFLLPSFEAFPSIATPLQQEFGIYPKSLFIEHYRLNIPPKENDDIIKIRKLNNGKFESNFRQKISSELLFSISTKNTISVPFSHSPCGQYLSTVFQSPTILFCVVISLLENLDIGTPLSLVPLSPPKTKPSNNRTSPNTSDIPNNPPNLNSNFRRSTSFPFNLSQKSHSSRPRSKSKNEINSTVAFQSPTKRAHRQKSQPVDFISLNLNLSPNTPILPGAISNPLGYTIQKPPPSQFLCSVIQWSSDSQGIVFAFNSPDPESITSFLNAIIPTPSTRTTFPFSLIYSNSTTTTSTHPKHKTPLLLFTSLSNSIPLKISRDEIPSSEQNPPLFRPYFDVDENLNVLNFLNNFQDDNLEDMIPLKRKRIVPDTWFFGADFGINGLQVLNNNTGFVYALRSGGVGLFSIDSNYLNKESSKYPENSRFSVSIPSFQR